MKGLMTGSYLLSSVRSFRCFLHRFRCFLPVVAVFPLPATRNGSYILSATKTQQFLIFGNQLLLKRHFWRHEDSNIRIQQLIIKFIFILFQCGRRDCPSLHV